MSNIVREEGYAMQNNRIDITGMFEQIDAPGQGIAREGVARELAAYLGVQIASIRRAYGIRLPLLQVEPASSGVNASPVVQHIDRGRMIDDLLEAQQGRLPEGRAEQLLLALQFQMYRLRAVVMAQLQQRYDQVEKPADDAMVRDPGMTADGGGVQPDISGEATIERLPEIPAEQSVPRGETSLAA